MSDLAGRDYDPVSEAWIHATRRELDDELTSGEDEPRAETSSTGQGPESRGLDRPDTPVTTEEVLAETPPVEESTSVREAAEALEEETAEAGAPIVEAPEKDEKAKKGKKAKASKGKNAKKSKKKKKKKKK